VLEVSQLQTLTAAEFSDCAYQLGRVDNFTAEQWKAIADVAKEVSSIVVISQTRINGKGWVFHKG